MTLPAKTRWLALFELSLCVCICMAYAGTPAPDVNESHYLIKAKHFWDAHFGQGDLFLESADAHWFFFSTTGWLTTLFNLEKGAWIGRTLVWILISVGWWRLTTGVSSRPFLSPLSLVPFLAAVDLGQLSGEWIVGGFEAKGIAYGLLLFGIGQAIRNEWRLAWIFFGFASAFHVVVGGWVTFTAMLTFGLVHRNANPFGRLWRKEWGGLIVGGACSLPGLLPALMINARVPSVISTQAAQIYVYERLPHHLSPLRFVADRWTQHLLWLICVAMFFLFMTPLFRNLRAWIDGSIWAWSDQSDRTISCSESERNGLAALEIIWAFALFACLIGLVGIVIDCIGLRHPGWAASLLRFYWFRWNDVAWPIAVTMTLVANGFVWSNIRDWRKWFALIMIFAPSTLWLVDRTIIQYNQIVPEADCRSLLMPNETPEQELDTFNDWVAACRWIREETPNGKVWLTPRYQQTFVWYAERGEVVNWKNVPQNATEIVEWNRRMNDVYRHTSSGGLIPNNTSNLIRLGNAYGVEYVLIDKRIYFSLPKLECIYPVGDQNNQSFAIYKIPNTSRQAGSVQP